MGRRRWLLRGSRVPFGCPLVLLPTPGLVSSSFVLSILLRIHGYFFLVPVLLGSSYSLSRDCFSSGRTDDSRLPSHLALSWVTCAIPDPSSAGLRTLLRCARPRRPIQTLEGFVVTSRPLPSSGRSLWRCPGEEAPHRPPSSSLRPSTLPPYPAHSRYTHPASPAVTDHGP